jgi:hypothetical protein
MRERKWNCEFLPAPPTRQIANVPGGCGNLLRRHEVGNRVILLPGCEEMATDGRIA